MFWFQMTVNLWRPYSKAAQQLKQQWSEEGDKVRRCRLNTSA